MTQREKTIRKMKNNPKGDWTIKDCQSLAGFHEIRWEHDGGSHCIFDFGEVSLSVPAKRPIKPIYIKQFLNFLDITIDTTVNEDNGENEGSND